jgi:putative addiction module component (TIGR02574 family)
MGLLTQDELVRLTPPERLALISQLWDSLEDNHLPLTVAQRAELDNRLATPEPRTGMSRFETLSLLLSALSLIISAVGFSFVWLQLDSANKSLKTGIYANMSNWTFDQDKTFLEHPDLRPYFFDGKDMDPGDPRYLKAESIAELLLDNFDSELEFGPYFPGGAPHQSWTNFMHDSFDNSPILVRTIEKDWRQYEHGPIGRFYKEWQREKTSGGKDKTK